MTREMNVRVELYYFVLLFFYVADREAVLAALRNMEACNPVLRAQSRATLSFFKR